VNAEWAVLLANSSHGQVLLGPLAIQVVRDTPGLSRLLPPVGWP